MTVRSLLGSLLLLTQSAKAQLGKKNIPDSLTNRDYDYLFNRIEENISNRERSIYLRTFVSKAKNEENWEELSNGYKNYVHYAPKPLQIKYADSMVVAAKRTGDDAIIGGAYLSKGIAYYGQKRLSQAMDSYLKADAHIAKTCDQYLHHKAKYQIAQVKYYLGLYDEAIALFKDCASYFKDTNTRAYLNCLHSLGSCHKLAGNHSYCTEVNELGISVGISSGNRDMESYFILSEGVNQTMIHNYKSAIQKLQAALIEISQGKDFSNEMVAYYYLGKSYWGMDHKEKAVAYFMKVDALYDKHGYIRPDLIKGYELLISYYREKGMLEEHLKYVEKLLAVDRKKNDTKEYLHGKIAREYDTKQLMSQQRHLKKELRSRMYNDRIFTAVIVTMLFFLAFIVIRHRKNKIEAKKKYDELLQRIEASARMKSQKTEEGDSVMSKDAEAAVLLNLQKFENGRKFLDKELNLTKLAGQFNTNTKYLSQIIQKHRNKKFTEYINGLKIEHIAERIRNEKSLRNYTHDALAEEAGFSSTRRFVNAFQASTAISPKYFIEELRKEKD